MKMLAIFAAAVGFAACARGETVTEEPDAFLEYVEATGSQYIDTGVNAETGLKAQIDFAWASGDISGKDWSLLDATIDNSVSSKRTRFQMCHLYGGGGKPYFGYGKQRKNPAGSVPFVGGQRCEIITDMTDPDSLELYQDGVKTFNEEDLETFKTNGVVNLHLNLFVFACNLSSVPKWHGQGRLYELKIWKKNLESGELDLICHYLPCVKGGRAGLYDTVYGTISYSYSDDNFIAGPVISNEPTLITTREELAAITNNLGGFYALGADIDLGDTDWTPIGNDSEPFTGTLRGNGHAIRNLFCTNSLSGADYRGLFGCVSNATIESVSVSGTVAGKQYVGGLVGCITGGTVISNCIATVEIAATNSYAGGLVGACAGGSAVNRIVDCRADGFVSGSGMAGGFIGYVYAPAVISNCVARGDVRSAASYYGGFVGRLAHDDAIIDGCWCSCAVWGTGGDIGSFLGHHVRGTNVNCAVSAYANGPRPFCGNDPAVTGDRLTQTEIKALSTGWPEAPKRAKSSAMIPISTPEELLAVTNNLSGSYVLTADIDFDGETIEPIGNYRNPFKGEFYGQNHKISNFYINTTAKYAGLFGKINGGRVSGVQVKEGYVTGGPADSGLEDVGVGGLAGKIDSKSLVDGCWFVGEVWNTNSVNAGGFVGYTADAPVILRCCVESYVANESGKSYTGGFVGNHGGGFIADSSAQSSVDSSDGYGGNGGDNVGGFAGGVSKAARIATSWCYSYVSSDGGHYRGAFVGLASSGLVTGSYYEDTENDLKAVGTSSGSDDYDGITPLGDEEMQRKESFTALDFDDVWKIDEETYPYLRTLFSAYELWLNDVGITDGPKPDDMPKPEDMVEGIPAGIRYVFGIDPSIGPADLAEPLIDIGFDADGNPYVKVPPLVNTEGATVTVLATEDLNDWSNAEAVEVTVHSDGTLVFPRTAAPARFFRFVVSM